MTGVTTRRLKLNQHKRRRRVWTCWLLLRCSALCRCHRRRCAGYKRPARKRPPDASPRNCRRVSQRPRPTPRPRWRRRSARTAASTCRCTATSHPISCGHPHPTEPGFTCLKCAGICPTAAAPTLLLGLPFAACRTPCNLRGGPRGRGRHNAGRCPRRSDGAVTHALTAVLPAATPTPWPAAQVAWHWLTTQPIVRSVADNPRTLYPDLDRRRNCERRGCRRWPTCRRCRRRRWCSPWACRRTWTRSTGAGSSTCATAGRGTRAAACSASSAASSTSCYGVVMALYLMAACGDGGWREQGRWLLA